MTGPGAWRRHAALSEASLTDEQKKAIENLEAIGYVGGPESKGASGVTVKEPGASTGVNLYTDGHAPEAVLMDTERERASPMADVVRRSVP